MLPIETQRERNFWISVLTKSILWSLRLSVGTSIDMDRSLDRCSFAHLLSKHFFMSVCHGHLAFSPSLFSGLYLDEI